MKVACHFQHDYNARNDPKLQDVLVTHGAAGIGVFWCIVEQLYEQDGFLPLKSCKTIASALHVEINVVEALCRTSDCSKTTVKSSGQTLQKRVLTSAGLFQNQEGLPP